MSATGVSSTTAASMALVPAVEAGGLNFEVISDCRPYKFCSSDSCPISVCTFAELVEQSAPFSAHIVQVLGPQSSQRFNRKLLEIINLFLGEIQDGFVALVKDNSNNSALFEVESLKAFYLSKEWQVFVNPVNRQDVSRVTVLGICAVSGIVSRYRICPTLLAFRQSLVSSTTDIRDLIEHNLVDEEEVLNFIEMQIRTRGWCHKLVSLDDIVLRFNKDPLKLLAQLENIFDRFVCPVGYERLGRFYGDSFDSQVYKRDEAIYLSRLSNRNKAIYFYEKALRLMPNYPDPDPKRSRLLVVCDSDVYERLARIYLEEGRLVEALQRVQTAMQWSPDRRTDLRMLLLARIYKALGNFDEAQEQLLAILKRGDGSTEVYIELAEISMGCGRFSLAREYLDSALKKLETMSEGKFFARIKIQKVSRELAVAQYEQALALWDELSQAKWDKKKDIYQRRQAVVKQISSPETMFEIFKKLCFGSNENYESTPELSISEQEMSLSDNAKLASDGAFLISARQVPFRVMQGYNPILKLHFVALKGLTVFPGYRPLQSVQIICQSRIFKGAAWVSNGTQEVCHVARANILQQFMGEGSDDSRGEYLLGDFTREQHRNLVALKIFIDAPKIMKAASTILSAKLSSPVASKVIDYYSFEA